MRMKSKDWRTWQLRFLRYAWHPFTEPTALLVVRHFFVNPSLQTDTCVSSSLAPITPPIPLSPCHITRSEWRADSCCQTMDQKRRSWRAADGQRGGWVKVSFLIIQGSSLIMSESKVKKKVLVCRTGWKSVSWNIYQVWQSQYSLCPAWRE